MKNIYLSIVIICALAIAGIGGTLANFSDTEEVFDNTFESGSLDLLIWDGANWVNDPPWGPGVTEAINVDCAAPEGVYSSTVYVANFGECVSGRLYLRFKELRCYNVDVWNHDATGIWKYDADNLMEPYWRCKPEPELVAEYGGFIDQWEYIPSPDPVIEGDNCSWSKILKAKVLFDGVMVQDWKLLSQLIAQPGASSIWIDLGDLPYCGETHEVEIRLKYQDQECAAWTGDPKFADWPTNRYMLDGAKFNMMFGLVQPVG